MKPDGTTDTSRAQGAAEVPADLDLGIVLDRVAELIVVQDDQMRVIWANRAAGASVGTEPEALLGRQCYDIWQGRDEPCVGCPVLQSINTGDPAQAEVKSTDNRHWFIKGYPLRDAGGAISGAIEITMDIRRPRRRSGRAARDTATYFSIRATPYSCTILTDISSMSTRRPLT